MSRKLLWLGVAPWAPTGYGDQARVFMPRIRDLGYDVAMSCMHGLEYMAVEWEGMHIFPRDYTGQNKIVLKEHVREFGAGDHVQVVTLFDIWPFVNLRYGGCVADFAGLDIASWVPIDTLGVPPGSRDALDRFQIRPIAMSRHGETQLRDAGYDPLYVPHGIETAVMRPNEDRAACRGFMNLPEDAFVVGMVAHNAGVIPSRKAFPEALQAFRIFQADHDDAFLYLHTDVSGKMDPSGGLDLLAIANYLGIPQDRVAVVNQASYLRSGFSKQQMAGIYSGLDVLLNPSLGEGFGLPIVEAQACGTPVIVNNWTSMTELVGPGWLVGGQPWLNPVSGGIWSQPDVIEIVAALELAYEARGDQTLRDRAREFAMQYDADHVMETYWKPALEALEKPREVPPLRPIGPNRAMRRAAGKVAA